MDRPEPAHGKARARRLWDRMSKTRRTLTDRLNTVVTGKKAIDPTLLDDLEEILLSSDIGVETTVQLIEGLKQRVDQKSLDTPEQVKTILKEEMISFLDASQDLSPLNLPEKVSRTLHVVMFVGVNGVGKTTTIAKMAHYFRAQGQKVMLAAADTFRAAAIEQLQIWGDRVGAEVISQKRGADPGAVVFDAISAAKARKIDKVFIDTAGRLHTKSNLMEELKKIKRVADRALPGAPHEVLLVLDATTGQNAISQARQFREAVEVTGIALAKLDGTAKGGIVVAIRDEFGI
ncbi:MAG: signal recognition particle-docking protein FtsY, partial [Desulfatiglandales bacterium]